MTEPTPSDASLPAAHPAEPERFRLALGQLNPVVGDIEGNLAKARAARAEAARHGADLLMLPELFWQAIRPRISC